MADERETFERARALVARARNPDAGFGPSPGAPSEPEPTALAALALDDDDARAWLVRHQRADGSFGIVDGFVRDEGATGLAALAMPEGTARERALDHLDRLVGRTISPDPVIPLDGSIPGWPWTDGSFSWVEPTSRALLALRTTRPTSARIDGAVALLRDRRSVGGGWNYGNREVLGEELPPFGHTTAIALLALLGLDAALEHEGRRRLRSLWRDERAGALTLALARGAFALADDDAEVWAIDDALARALGGGVLDDVVTAAWIAVTTGPALDRLGTVR